MQTLDQIEREVRQLPAKEQKLLLTRLANLVANGERSVSGTREESLGRFFADWDNTHSVSVGETPSRSRTYADNSRFH